jgi:hypothetical protein
MGRRADDRHLSRDARRLGGTPLAGRELNYLASLEETPLRTDDH